ncbi:MAG: hypothetical protein K2Y37_20510 [Pirellulales bacterium]|nr:hypothetical protein [Pirellulales bacterium]
MIQDRLGTVRNVIDNNRVIWNHAQFDAFGNRVSLDYPHTNPATPLERSLTRFGFTGQEYDETTGLTWYSNGEGNGNWYDPKTNTWIKRDSLPVRALNPNAYVYAANGPTNFVDPNGQEIYDVPTGTRPNPGSIAGYGGATAPNANLGPKIGLDDFNQPDIALLDSENRQFAQPSISEEDAILVLELAQTAFDIAGIFDPTPACDAGAAVCSLVLGDIRGAGINVVAMFPYLGDFAKLGKLPKKISLIQKIAERAAESAAFADKVRPHLEKLLKALDDVLPCLPKQFKGPLEEARNAVREALEGLNKPRNKWTPGDDVHGPTTRSPIPSDSTVRRRSWKNEAEEPTRSDFTPEDMERMRRGLPPQRYNPDKGDIESMERSHEPEPKREGGRTTVPRWPQEHSEVDPQRRPGY